MRIKQVIFVVPVIFASALGVTGCGDDAKTGTIEVSPEAKKADESGQKGMQDFMQSKGQPKR